MDAYTGDVPSEALVRNTVHAPNHSSGQGVSLAVESAVEFSRCLRDVDDPSMAFTAYEQLRRLRVTKIADEANRRNRHKAAGPIVTAIMNVVMRVATKTFMTPDRMFGWIHGYRINWDERVPMPTQQIAAGARPHTNQKAVA